MITIGYDIGSSSIKAALYDVESGKSIAQGTYPKDEMKISSPQPGWAEQDPNVWWESVKAATRDVLSKSGISSSDVKAIGISYQMHGLVVVDKSQKVLRPSIIWCDSRAVEIGNKAFDKLGKEKCLHDLLNSPGNFTASKLRWVIENEPQKFRETDKFMLPGDYIAMKLSGEVTTTKSGLSEGILWNFRKDEPAGFLMEHFGMKDTLVPKLVDGFGVQCVVSKQAAADIGLAAGTPITYRAGDQPNNAYSLNVLRPGEIASTAGTSGVVYGVSDQIKYDPLGRVNTFAHVNHSDKEKRLGILLCINGTGISYSWIRRALFGQPVAYDELNMLAEKSPAGSAGIVFLPFGNGAERMLTNLEIGSSFDGINFNLHDRSNIVRAVLEGVAFSFYYGIRILGELGVNAARIRAGLANLYLNKVFRTTVATLTGAEIQLYNTDGSLGAARAAAYGAGFYKSPDEAFRGLECVDTVTPDKVNDSAYRSAFEKWNTQLQKRLNQWENK